MNVTKGIAILTLTALALPAQRAQGGFVQTTNANAPRLFSWSAGQDSSVGNTTYTARPDPPPPGGKQYWNITGTITESNFYVFGAKSVTANLEVTHLLTPGGTPPPGGTMTFPAMGVGTPISLPKDIITTFTPVTLSAVHTVGGVNEYDYALLTGTARETGNPLGFGPVGLTGYTYSLVAEHAGAGKVPAFAAGLVAQSGTTSDFGSVASLYNIDTNQNTLSMSLIGLQTSDITDVLITSSVAGFVPIDLGASFLTDVPGAVFSSGMSTFAVPLQDQTAFLDGEASIEVVTGNSDLELAGSLDPVGAPEPSSLTLLLTGALGALGYGWRRRKCAIV